MGLSINVSAKAVYIILMTASLLAVCQGRTVVVGGSEGWRSGYNYTDWAIDNSPFYLNDKLVFKYNPRSDHKVYLLPNLWSYITCDFRYAKLLGKPNQGSGKGFEVVINQWRPYYFASNSNNCNSGLMKFFAVPWPR